MDRRKFVTTAGLAGTAGLLAACGNQGSPAAGTGSASRSEETFHWKMVTTWPRDFPGLGRGAARLAELAGLMSSGRLTIKVYGGGELVPPLEVFSAVRQGTAEIGHGAAYYWRGQVKAGLMFTGIPFGLSGPEILGWLYHGGGNELYRESYAPHGLIPFPAGCSGTQMGGWFKKEIRSAADLNGLKMRIPGIGGEALQRAGGTPVNVPASEVFTALQSGVVDAAEWVGPMNDLALGLHQAAPYYYYPGWQEPGSVLECIVNAEAWATLPEDLQYILATACQAVTTDMYAEFEARNGEALAALVEQHGVQLRAFPDDVLAVLKEHTFAIVEELAASDPMVRKTWDSFRAYMELALPSTDVGMRYFINHR